MKVGMAAGLAFRRGDHRHRVVIGKDTRLSGYMIESALIAGFTAVGMDVLLLGPMPTPAVAMLTRSMRADLGVMISASHNPFDDNGIKLFAPDGYKLSDEVEAEIEALIDADLDAQLRAVRRDRPRQAHRRRAGALHRIRQAHRRRATSILEGLRVVIDCANGAAYKVAPEALWELGAEVSRSASSRTASTSTRTSARPRPTRLIAKVRELRADIGIALDGDADRVIIVDEKGQVVDGDQLMAVIAASWAEDGRLSRAGPRRDRDVQSRPRALSRRASASTLERTPVGDRYVLERMRAKGYNVGGEQSGHIILSDFADDRRRARRGAAAARRGAEGRQRPVSEICHRFEPVPQILKNVRFKSGKPLDDEPVRAVIADATTRLGTGGRLVIRPSGTEPVIRVMAEGDDRGLVADVVDDVVDVITKAAA